MENTNIITAAIAGSDIPRSWLYCFNSGCTLRNECVRYLSSSALSPARTSGPAVYPTAAGPECPHFKQLRTIRSAWGFTLMFANVRTADAPLLRALMKARLGGNGMYYRYHHGQRRLTPEQQAWIKSLFRHYGYDKAEFEHYRDEIDFTQQK